MNLRVPHRRHAAYAGDPPADMELRNLHALWRL